MKGKNKLQPILFGVCKESVMRVDEKTKRVSIIYNHGNNVFVYNVYTKVLPNRPIVYKQTWL